MVSHIPNFSTENAVWIGDSLSADIKAANEANVTSIWYNRHKKEATGEVIPDYAFEKFDEILAFLQEINKN